MRRFSLARVSAAVAVCVRDMRLNCRATSCTESSRDERLFLRVYIDVAAIAFCVTTVAAFFVVLNEHYACDELYYADVVVVKYEWGKTIF